MALPRLQHAIMARTGARRSAGLLELEAPLQSKQVKGIFGGFVAKSNEATRKGREVAHDGNDGDDSALSSLEENSAGSGSMSSLTSEHYECESCYEDAEPVCKKAKTTTAAEKRGKAHNVTRSSEKSAAMKVARKKPHGVSGDAVPRVANVAKFVGAHVSAAGGPENAIPNALKIGTWNSKPLTEDSIIKFKQACVTHGYDPVKVIVPHGSYLVNLGNPDKEKREKSFSFVLDELQRCDSLGIRHYNFHPGSTVGQCEPSEAIQFIASCINRLHEGTKHVVTVVENMAGQGNVVGNTFEQLKEIVDLVKNKERVGVCLDTCHLFAAGYDIRDRKSYEQTFQEFDNVVGIKYLKAFHLNDSKGDLGSCKDRHAPLGEGCIGLEPFAWIMKDPRFDGLPFIIETPDEDKYIDEVKKLNGFHCCINMN